MIPAQIQNRILELLPQVVEIQYKTNPAAVVLMHSRAKSIGEFAEKFCNIKLKPLQAEALNEFWHGRIQYTELVLVWGRKSGKTLITAICILYTTYLLLMEDNPHAKYGILQNQKLYALLVSVDKEQAIDVGLNYIKTIAKGSWFFKPLIRRETAVRLEFVKNIVIKAQPSSSRTSRGYPCFFIFFDELAWFMDTNGNASGTEVYAALKPNVKVFGNDGRTAAVSSPAGKSGQFHDMYEDSSKEGSTILMRQAATWEVNPDITYEMLKEEFRRDPEKAEREYGAKFSDVVDAFIPAERIDMARKTKLISPFEIDPRPRSVAMDPGHKHDRYAFASAVKVNDDIIIDFVKYWQGSPTNPVDVEEVERFMEDFNKAKSVRVWGMDQHQSTSTIQKFKKKRWNIIETTFTGSYNMDIYTSLREAIYGDKIVLPEDELAIKELKFLRRTGMKRNFSVSAPTSGSCTTDDVADAMANAHFLAKDLGGNVTFEVSALANKEDKEERICPYCMELFPIKEKESYGDFIRRFELHKKKC